MAIAIRAKQGLTRRHLLVRSASTVALAGLGSLARPDLSRGADRPLIANGLASGDAPTASAAVWARADTSARMRVECSTVESFRTIIRSASSDALPDHDFTSKVLLENLPPGQDIFYRVRFEDIGEPGISGETQVGHFRTAPTDKSTISRSSSSFVWSAETAGQGGWLRRGRQLQTGGARPEGVFRIHADPQCPRAGGACLSADWIRAAARRLSDRHAQLSRFDLEQARRPRRHLHSGLGAAGVAETGARGL